MASRTGYRGAEGSASGIFATFSGASTPAGRFSSFSVIPVPTRQTAMSLCVAAVAPVPSPQEVYAARRS